MIRYLSYSLVVTVHLSYFVGVHGQTEAPSDTEKRTAKIVESIETTAVQTRSMLQSLLLANSQSMFSVTNMQKSVDAMKKTMEQHDKDLAVCHLKLKEFESASQQSQQTWGEQSQINTSLLQMKSRDGLFEIETNLKVEREKLEQSRKILLSLAKEDGLSYRGFLEK